MSRKRNEEFRTRELYYITHIDNVPSILERGILSHDRVEEDQLKYTLIYDEQIVANRQSRLVPDGRTLWSFANLYFQPRNAMLYRVAHEKNPEDIAIVAVRREIMDNPDTYFSTGNAAHSQSNILNRTKAAKDLMPLVKEAVAREWWSEADGSKRTMVAECLVPQRGGTRLCSISLRIKLRICRQVEGKAWDVGHCCHSTAWDVFRADIENRAHSTTCAGQKEICSLSNAHTHRECELCWCYGEGTGVKSEVPVPRCVCSVPGFVPETYVAHG